MLVYPIDVVSGRESRRNSVLLHPHKLSEDRSSLPTNLRAATETATKEL